MTTEPEYDATSQPAQFDPEEQTIPFDTVQHIYRGIPYFRKAKVAARYQIDPAAQVAGSMFLALGAANELHFRAEHRDDFETFEAMTEADLAQYIEANAPVWAPKS